MKYQLYHNSITKYNPDLITLKIEELDQIEQNSIQYINIYNILELEDIDVSVFIPKLRLKGSISLVGADINKLCELYLDNILSLEEFQNLTLDKKLYTVSYIVSLLTSKQFKIISVKMDNFIYYIEFGRSE